MWKKIINKQTKQVYLKHLTLENSAKEKTKDIIFNDQLCKFKPRVEKIVAGNSMYRQLTPILQGKIVR